LHRFSGRLISVFLAREIALACGICFLFQQAYFIGPAFKISGLDFDRFASEPMV
jgi:hypothetical protein